MELWELVLLWLLTLVVGVVAGVVLEYFFNLFEPVLRWAAGRRVVRQTLCFLRLV